MHIYRSSTAVALVLALMAGSAAQAAAQTAYACQPRLERARQTIADADLSHAERREAELMARDAQQATDAGKAEQCLMIVGDLESFADPARRAEIVIKREQARVSVKQKQPQVAVEQPSPKVTVRQARPEVTVNQAQPRVTVRQAKPQVHVAIPKPEITVRQGQPVITVTQAEPEVTVEQDEPQVKVSQKRPQVSVEMANPEVTVEQPQPEIVVEQPQPKVVVEKQRPDVNVQQQQAAVTVEQAKPEVSVEQQEPKVAVHQQDAAVDVSQQKPEVTVEQEKAEVTVEQQEPKVEARQPSDRETAADDGGTAPATRQQAQARQSGERNTAAAAEGRPRLTVDTNPLFGLRVDELEGEDVYNARGESIGDIEDVLIARNDGRIFVLLSVGGLLGIGDKEVAVALDQLQRQGDRIMMPGETEDSLEALPEYDVNRYNALETDRRPADYVR